MDRKIITIERHITEQQRRYPEATGVFSDLGRDFYYPADTRNPRGKLRLVYEAIPLAFVAEQAGGYASDGHRNILDVQPQSLHQRTPLFIGNRDLVEQAEGFISRYDG